jgi:hypothetical protein
MKDFREFLQIEIQGRTNNSFIKPCFGEESLDYTQGFVWGELKAYQKILERWDKITEDLDG